ncbi:MAG: GH1 family beta-glucosidase [Chloroflexota bacterium]
MSGTAAEIRFPPGFIWGSGTSSYQVEGAIDEDGRGPSIWDTFSARPGAVLGGDTGDIAADQYHRWPEDIALLQRLGHRMYRFSVAWPRIQPAGRGAPEQRGLDHYRRLVDGLLEAGIEPNITLYHWDLPQALQDAGGWPGRDIADRFADYAAIVYEALHDRVGWWATINEPWCVSLLSHAAGVHAPGEQDAGRALRAIHHVLLAHGRGIAAMRAIDASPRLGIVLNPAPVVATPGAEGPAIDAGIAVVDGYRNRVWLDPLLRGQYPGDLLSIAERFGGLPVEVGDLAAIAAPLDWLGVNYYHDIILGPAAADDILQPGAGPVEEAPPPGERTSMGWPITPTGLTDLLLRIRRDWPNVPPIVVSENGAAWDDPIAPDGTIDDARRVRYLHDHLAAIGDAIAAGVDVRGYLVWSLLDNFEWAWGYRERFGIVHVDYSTQVRTPRRSAWWLRDVIVENALTR